MNTIRSEFNEEITHFKAFKLKLPEAGTHVFYFNALLAYSGSFSAQL